MTEGDYDALYQVLADSDIMQHYPYIIFLYKSFLVNPVFFAFFPQLILAANMKKALGKYDGST